MEKLFEIQDQYTDTLTFIKNMVTMCYFSRVDYPEELLMEEANTARENYMAQNILNYKKEYKRILVVTGGFHTTALMELIKSQQIQERKPVFQYFPCKYPCN